MGLFKKAIDRMVSEKVTHKGRKRMIIFVAIITLLSMVTSTVAWFTVNTFAGVQLFELNISTGEDLRVSMENHGADIEQYTHVITNDMVNTYLGRYNTTLNDLLLAPVTTNNVANYTFENGTAVEPNRRGTYLEFKCWFIGTRDMYVHLTTEGNAPEGEHVSTIENGVVGTRVATTSPAPQSDIVSAIRVGFNSDSGSNTWEPNKNGQSTSLPTFDLPSGNMVYSNENQLFHLDPLTPKEVTISVWMEGEDPECDNDVQGAQLQVQLAFVACDENGTPVA